MRARTTKTDRIMPPAPRGGGLWPSRVEPEPASQAEPAKPQPSRNGTAPSLLSGLAMSLASLTLTLLVLEFVVFRTLLVPDDLIENVTINEVVRYRPGTEAVFRHPGGRESRVSINAEGFNSSRQNYPLARTPGVTRIAVIGDSYVHAAYVDVEKAFPEVLEKRLEGAGVRAEVFRFGMDGAPLSQYLHVLRREVLRLRPDVVVVPLIHNDFDEMYRGVRTRYASSFMKLARGLDGAVDEVAPVAFKPGLADRLRASAAFRYLYYETNLYLGARSFVSRYFWGGEEAWDEAYISSAVDIRKINDHDQNRYFARYVLAEMKRLSERYGFKLAMVMDGVREAVYEGRDPMDYEVGRLNRIAAELTDEFDIPFVDLQAPFAADYAKHARRFEFTYDWHWNEHANALVADVLFRMLTSDPRLALPDTSRTTAVAPPTRG